jgi:hypothetical protein
VWQRELLARDIVVALPKQDKLRIRQAFRSWRYIFIISYHL